MSIANKQLLIAAFSSRIYAEAAVNAGFDVVAIDAFGDADLKQSVAHCYQIDALDGQLDTEQLLAVLNQLDKNALSGFCYGAGFEAQPEVLNQISSVLTVLGNTAEVVDYCKQPKRFFHLCEQLHIPFPAVCYQRPSDCTEWLQKTIGASGGGHVVPVCAAQQPDSTNVYYQQYQKGRALSCLFAVLNGSIEIIGFHLQWTDSDAIRSYRYSGAVSTEDMSVLARKRFAEYIQKLTFALGLQGVNSCDAICDGDQVYLLEINPRLSASVDLYPESAVIQKHLLAFDQHVLQPQAVVVNQQQVCRGHQIIYATHPVVIKNEITWPNWVHDVPCEGQQIDKGMPVCTVSAEAHTETQTKMVLTERAAWIAHQLLNEWNRW